MQALVPKRDDDDEGLALTGMNASVFGHPVWPRAMNEFVGVAD